MPAPGDAVPPAREVRLDQLRLLLTGLAAGDSLGTTAEFIPREDVPRIYARRRDSGWPFRQAGGNGWDVGEPTDDTDMALCIARSFLDLDRFDGEDVAGRLVHWMRRGPKDIGTATAQALSRIEQGQPWTEAAWQEYRRNPRSAPNGSLIRNGIVPALAGSLDEAFRISLLQGIITHYHPLPVLCCAAQTYLIWGLLQEHSTLPWAWIGPFRDRWNGWIDSTPDPVCQEWRGRMGEALDAAWSDFRRADFDPDRFSPFRIAFPGRAGYSLLTLQIAVWAAAWSLRGTPLPTPLGFPAEVFQRTGPWVLSWVAMVGHDCDSYGATAGPLVAAIHGAIPEELTANLRALRDPLVRSA
jgi:hypothetical protein